MDIAKHLAALAQPDPESRRAALEAALAQEGLTAEVQEGTVGEKNPVPARNYCLWPDPAEDETPCPLLCAHYDAYPGSPGANDNAAALCVLIALAGELRRRNIRCAFAFLDGEERGHTGGKLFEAQRTREFTVVVNLDMCGYGDTLAVYVKGGQRKPAAAVFTDKKRLTAHNARTVRYIPEGDEVCFSSRRQPVLSMAVLPKWDLKYLDAIAAHGGGLLGRPPEMRMIVADMEVSATMHGAYKDRAEWVQPAAMEQIYGYLLDALTAPLPEKRFLF